MVTRILVCGGRDFADVEAVNRALDAVLAKHPDMIVIHGAARGADTLAARWAAANDVRCEAYPADWSRHGRAAGPLRNQAMLDTGVSGCVAFPGGRGTADMVKRCRMAGVPVWQP